jgi:hypothetical protein
MFKKTKKKHAKFIALKTNSSIRGIAIAISTMLCPDWPRAIAFIRTLIVITSRRPGSDA